MLQPAVLIHSATKGRSLGKKLSASGAGSYMIFSKNHERFKSVSQGLMSNVDTELFESLSLNAILTQNSAGQKVCSNSLIRYYSLVFLLLFGFLHYRSSSALI